MSLVLGLCFFLSSIGQAGDAPVAPLAPNPIASYLKPVVLERVVSEREVMAHAKLDEPDYSFYGAMRVSATPEETFKTLTNYPLYVKMIPYVHQAEYSPVTQIVRIRGGIFGFELISDVKIEAISERWLKYKIVGGHFRGLAGEFIIEDLPQSVTKGKPAALVLFRGGIQGRGFPPKLIVERGAEIVFGFTGKRMRDYIEHEHKK